MTETLTRYRIADYLETEEDIAAYLEAAMTGVGDDAAFIVRVLATIAEARSMAQLVRDAGMTRQWMALGPTIALNSALYVIHFLPSFWYHDSKPWS